MSSKERHTQRTGMRAAIARIDALELDRRQFLGTGAALGAGGAARQSRAERMRQPRRTRRPPPHPPPAPPGRPPPPPEPTVSQPPPLKDLKGKVAYITAASDGIGLGIARAASNAGMKVVIGYRNEERLKAALPLFKKGNAGVLAIKHDVTDRDGWKSAARRDQEQVRQAASRREQRRRQDAAPGEPGEVRRVGQRRRRERHGHRATAWPCACLTCSSTAKAGTS